MSIVKISVLAMLVLLLVLTVKKERAEFAFLIELAGAAVLLVYVAVNAKPIAHGAGSLLESAGVNDAYLGLLVKALLTAAAAEAAAAVCRDNGAAALAVNIETAAKLIIIVLCLPMLETVAGLAAQLMGA